MFIHIIENPKLVRNPQNTWKHYRTKVAETDTKLADLLSKLHGPNKGGLGPSCTWIICINTSSWCFKGSQSSALDETCTTIPFNAFTLDPMMGPFGTCNGSLVFVGTTSHTKCNIPHSGIKTTISCQPKNRVIEFFFLYIFMVFVLKSTEISTESPLYRKVPSYRHLTCLHF
jgi:hypothetical protein